MALCSPALPIGIIGIGLAGAAGTWAASAAAAINVIMFKSPEFRMSAVRKSGASGWRCGDFGGEPLKGLGRYELRELLAQRQNLCRARGCNRNGHAHGNAAILAGHSIAIAMLRGRR